MTDQTDHTIVKLQVVAPLLDATPATARSISCTADIDVEEGRGGEHTEDTMSRSSCLNDLTKRRLLRMLAPVAAIITVVVILTVQSLADISLVSIDAVVQAVKTQVESLLVDSTVRPLTSTTTTV